MSEAPLPEPLPEGVGRFIADNFDAVLLDQFGVVHNGVTAYDGAAECLRELGKRVKIIVLSNSTKRGDHVAQSFTKKGLDPASLAGCVTSGDLTFGMIGDFISKFGPKCYVLQGPDGDLGTWRGETPLQFVDDISEADFMLGCGVVHQVKADGSVQCLGEFPDACRPVLKAAAERGLHFVCGNPDFLAPPLPDGSQIVCPGSLARLYETEYGGKCTYMGKPHAVAYEAAMQILDLKYGIKNRDRVVMVGDSLQHDAVGAEGSGVKCVWIQGGVHAEELGVPPQPARHHADAGLVRACVEKYGVSPAYLARGFVW